MTPLLDPLVRGSLVIGAGLIASWLLRRRSAALRHLIVAGALLVGSLIPVLQLLLPHWTVSAPPEVAKAVLQTERAIAAEPLASAVPEDSDAAGTAYQLASVLAVIWLAGASAMAIRLGAALTRLRTLARRARPIHTGPWAAAAREVASSTGVRRPVLVLETDDAGILATWGLRRPRIMLPLHARAWSDERMRAVLHHEIAHIRRSDWTMQLTAEIIRSIYWFNPLVSLACRQLHRLSERACDDAVLGAGVSPGDYARHLLEIARSAKTLPFPVAAAVPMARPSTLQSRVAAMLNPRLVRTGLSASAVALVLVGLFTLAIPAAAIRVIQAGPAPLTGVVYDPTGAVLPQVALTLEDERQNRWTATSDSAGRFEFPPVQAGKYTLEAAVPGFKSLSQSLSLAAARDWARAVTLQVGDLRETITVRERRKGDRPAAATGPTPVRVGGNIRPPTKIRHVSPTYPESMRDAGIEGTVPLEARIDRAGNVVSLRVLSAQVHPDLARAAQDAVQQWRFSPTLLNGEAVDVVMTVSIEFQLAD
jgi:TonB family protein